MTDHVLFDGKPSVICHVCTFHREIASGIPCCQERQNGECAHVQYRVCDCRPPEACSLCPEEAVA